MTDVQKTTANQIIKDFRGLFNVTPIPAATGASEIYHRRNNGPILHPHYKEIHNGNLLFGVGTEYTEYGMLVIGINSWKIIDANGEIIDKENYTKNDLEMTKHGIEISGYSSHENLIRF